MKKFAGKLALVLALTMVGSTMAGCSADTGDGVAKYGDEIIPLSEPEFLMRYEQWTSEQYYWDMYTYFGYDNMWTMTGSNGTETYGEEVHDNAMAEILQERILMDHAADYDIDGLTDEQKQKVADAVDEFLEANPLFTEHVTADRDQMVQYMENNALASLVIQAVKDAANVEVTEEEYQKYAVEYIKVAVPEEETEAETEEGETAAEETTEAVEETEAAEEDTLEGLQLANEILKQADAGTDFSDIADQYDDATETSTSYLVTGETSTDAAYTASQSLAVGEITIVDNSSEGDGWYIVKKVNDLDEDASEEEKESLISDKETEAFDEVYAGWSDSAKKFTVDQEQWDEVTISDKIYETEAEETEAAETEAAETEAAETEAAETEAAETEAN